MEIYKSYNNGRKCSDNKLWMTERRRDKVMKKVIENGM